MQTSESPKTQALANLVPKLMGLATLAENLANRFKGAVLFGAGSGLLAAVWLGWFVAHAWQFSTTAAYIWGVALAVPALVAGWCWSVLDDASGMPRRILEWINRVHLYAGGARQRFQGAQEVAAEKGRFKDLWQLGTMLYELRSMGEDARDLFDILKGSLALSNPLFLFALFGSGLAIGLVDTLALFGGLYYLFR